jgi:hypothetical protein
LSPLLGAEADIEVEVEGGTCQACGRRDADEHVDRQLRPLSRVAYFFPINTTISLPINGLTQER